MKMLSSGLFLLAVLTPDALAEANRYELLLSFGSMIVELDPENAPETVKYFSELTAMNVYDGTHFYRVDRKFLAQVANVDPRFTTRSMPFERRTDRKHQRYDLTWARDPQDPESARSSFSILNAAAPHLDAQYTVFGKLVDGWDVFQGLMSVATNSQFMPMKEVRLISIREAKLNQKSQKLQAERLEEYLNPGHQSVPAWLIFVGGLACVIGFTGRIRPVRGLRIQRVVGAGLTLGLAGWMWREFEIWDDSARGTFMVLLLLSVILLGKIEDSTSVRRDASEDNTRLI